jgi:ectoine hydroxylase-related dioxygenase (phytanoyl-CoA dioxygenase family)
MHAPTLTASEIAAFHEDGYVIVPRHIPAEMVDLLHRVAKADRAMASAGEMKDAAGRGSKIYIKSDMVQDMYSAIVRSPRVVDPMEQLFGQEVYHLHHKMMLKEPRVGGAWEWHQDYGYWYNDNFLWPDMASCMIAVDRASRANGCLQVLRGSHKLGRIEHGRFGQQTGANPDRVEQIAKRLELVHVELEPGDALFFHSNTLHCSAANTSEFSRWSFICCYTTVTNQPYEVRFHGKYEPIVRMSDEQIMQVGRDQLTAMQGV